MQVLESAIGHPTYCREFGRVEAKVSLLVKTRRGQPPHWLHIRTSQLARGKEPLRQRLIADAIRLACAMHLDGMHLGTLTEPMRRAA